MECLYQMIEILPMDGDAAYIGRVATYGTAACIGRTATNSTMSCIGRAAMDDKVDGGDEASD
jgi:hypothetical protein